MHINIDNTNIFYDVYGSKLNIDKNTVSEKPTLIVLHGGHGFADHTLYVEFWSQFADMAQVIFIDQRGCGRSENHKPAEWNLRQWADDVYKFCQTLHIEKPIIAGVSMGGHVMCELVKRYNHFLGGLIFCNTEANYPLNAVCEKLKQLGGERAAKACYDFYTNPTLANLDNYTQYCIPYYAHNAYSKAELNRCIKNADVFLHYCKQEVLTFNYLEDLHKICCPTLLLVGEDSLHLVSAAEEMAAKIPENYLTMQIFAKAGAPVYKDKPVESYQVVKQFLLQFS